MVTTAIPALTVISVTAAQTLVRHIAAPLHKIPTLVVLVVVVVTQALRVLTPLQNIFLQAIIRHLRPKQVKLTPKQVQVRRRHTD